MATKKSRAAPFERRFENDPEHNFFEATAAIVKNLQSTADCMRKMVDGLSQLASCLQDLNHAAEMQQKREGESRAPKRHRTGATAWTAGQRDELIKAVKEHIIEVWLQSEKSDETEKKAKKQKGNSRKRKRCDDSSSSSS